MLMHFRHRDVKQCHVAPQKEEEKKKKKKKKRNSRLVFGKCTCVRHFWPPGSVTYQALPAKLLSALIIHCRLFTPVLHVFSDL